MKQAAIYMRMSTDKQEHSIESQRRLIQEYADQMGYSIYKEYIDEGISGRNVEKRPSFLQMIEESTKGWFQTLLIYDSSRFARNLEQSLVYKSMLKKNGVSLISVTEPVLDEDTSLITDALMGAMNEMYSRKLSKNVKRGMEQKALRGEYLSSPPFGYLRPFPKSPLVKDPVNSAIVAELFLRTKQGDSIFALVQDMKERGIQTRFGNPLECRTIQYILKNPVYQGYLKWHSDGKTIYKKADHEPIVSEALFSEVQEKINLKKAKIRKKQKPFETFHHWLSGLLICSQCGNTYVYAKGYHGRKDRFRCGGYLKNTCSASHSITVENAEALILGQLDQIFSFFPCHLEKREKNMFSDPLMIKKERKKIEQALKKAKEAYLFGIDSHEEYQQNKINLKKQLTEQEKKIEKSSLCLSISCFREFLNAPIEKEKKICFFHTIIEKILVDSNCYKLILFLRV